MATIKNKEVRIFRPNPKGNFDSLNTSTLYSIYFNSRKQYVLNITPCNETTWGHQTGMDFTNIPLVQATRRSAKTQRTCEDFLTKNIEAINTAYIHNGVAGVNEVVRDLWSIA